MITRNASPHHQQRRADDSVACPIKLKLSALSHSDSPLYSPTSPTPAHLPAHLLTHLLTHLITRSPIHIFNQAPVTTHYSTSAEDTPLWLHLPPPPTPPTLWNAHAAEMPPPPPAEHDATKELLSVVSLSVGVRQLGSNLGGVGGMRVVRTSPLCLVSV